MRKTALRRKKRHLKIKAKLKGGEELKLMVFRSSLHIYGALVDGQGKTLLSASDVKIKKAGKKTEKAFVVGKVLAEKAVKKNIKKVKFDRSGYLYHGRVKSLAEGAREGGLEF